MSNPLNPWSSRLATALSMIAVTQACDDMGPEPSLLDEPRVLAIRGEANGTDIRVEALTWQTPALTWTGCTSPWLPDKTPLCPSQTVDHGAGNPVIITPTSDTDRLYLRLDGGAVTAVTTLSTDPLPEHPDTPVVEADGAPLSSTVAAGAQLSVRTLVTIAGQPITEESVTTWFVSAGRVEPWRSLGSATSTFEVPSEPGPVTLIAVVRTESGGVAWVQSELAVTP